MIKKIFLKIASKIFYFYQKYKLIKFSNSANDSKFEIPNLKCNFFYNTKNKGDVIKLLQNKDKIIHDADEILNHNLDLLGSGKINLGTNINWHCDFKSGYVWDKNKYFKDIKYGNILGVDVKVPWELSRFQHLTTLGQAYWITDDEKYTQEFIEQINHWIENNSYLFGVNWNCTMDVAIRVVNWCFGFYFFKESKLIDDNFLKIFLKSIYIHQHHIFNDLENKGGLTSNHYLSNIVGLLFISLLFPEFKNSKEYLGFSISELEKEMEKQVYSDGVDFEASISYHRLVLEIFFVSYLLCKINNILLSEKFKEKLKKMFKYVLYYTKQNLKAPQIGDNDSGKLIKFSERDDNDHNYLLTIAGILFEDEKFKITEFDEEALWYFGKEGFDKFNKLRKGNEILLSNAFIDTGIYIIRDSNLYLIISCGPNGQNSNGGHSHNDKLSFELQYKGEDFIVDSGTYIYTPYPDERNLFRSTSYHNTVTVDDKEQNRFRGLFSLHNDAKARCILWETNLHFDKFTGEHYGYKKIGVVHKREITYNKTEKIILFKDIFTCQGSHKFIWNFCLGDDVKIKDVDGGFLLKNNGVEVFLILGNNDCKIEDSWVSYEYGSKIKNKKIKMEVAKDSDFIFEYQIGLK